MGNDSFIFASSVVEYLKSPTFFGNVSEYMTVIMEDDKVTSFSDTERVIYRGFSRSGPNIISFGGKYDPEYGTRAMIRWLDPEGFFPK